eukprot:gnl/TRDRNA2_/TRDRNA2_170709_c0_seq2.p1 gnl/TRDRNA2_/TRDRNA2_170709_c0~~gnl/TRDRNA2_/TRDRNA2_170709_c0_seq2.p1  ORF type:complete len:190 (+),score=32.01 gnl/TRDRNA2_/TRDRNA2_170709_c0_seq2:118-687(+)
MKLTTLAASTATAMFNAKIARICFDKGIDPDGVMLSTFDCRLGHYKSWEEARAVLLWRAIDCSTNGVSDAVFMTGPADTEVMGQDTYTKLQWLSSQDMLPLPSHQARGAYFVKVQRVIEGFNPKRQEKTLSTRLRIEQLDAHILDLVHRDVLVPADEHLPESAMKKKGRKRGREKHDANMTEPNSAVAG